VENDDEPFETGAREDEVNDNDEMWIID